MAQDEASPVDDDMSYKQKLPAISMEYRTPRQTYEERKKKELDNDNEGFMIMTIMYSIIAFSANDRYIVAGGTDGSITIWEIGTERCILKYLPRGQDTIVMTYEYGRPPLGNPGPPDPRPVNIIAFSPVPDSLVFVSVTNSGRAVWWNIATMEWKIIGESGNAHETGIRNVQWSPNGKVIATISTDSKIHIWDSSSLALLQRMEGGNKSLSQPLAFSPDSSYIVSVNSNFSVQMWDVRSGQCTTQLRGHRGPVWTFAFDHNARRLVTGSEDKTAQIWSVQTGEQLINLGEMGEAVWHVEFTPDGMRVCVGLMDGTAVLFDSFSGLKLCTIEGGDTDESSMTSQPQATLSPDGTKVAVAAGSRIMIFDSTTGQSLGKVEHRDSICGSIQFSHNGNHIAAVADDGSLEAWTLKMNGKELHGKVISLNV